MRRELLIYGWSAEGLTVLADSKSGAPKVLGLYKGEAGFSEFVAFLSGAVNWEDRRGRFALLGYNPAALRGHIFARSVKLATPFALEFLDASEDLDPFEIAARADIRPADMPAFYGIVVDALDPPDVPAPVEPQVVPNEGSDVTAVTPAELLTPPEYEPSKNADIDARLMFEIAKAWGLIAL